MAKVTGPLLSLGASGKIADTLVFGSWKGLRVARSYVVPANPNTAAQSTQRGHMTAAVAAWHSATAPVLDGDDKEAWGRYAGVLGPMSGFNAFCRSYINEEVAGGTPALIFGDEDNADPDADDFGVEVTMRGGATENVTVHIGNSLTFFPVTDTQAASSGVATFSAIDTGFAVGTRAYWYFDQGTPGAGYTRSGIYTGVLT